MLLWKLKTLCKGHFLHDIFNFSSYLHFYPPLLGQGRYCSCLVCPGSRLGSRAAIWCMLLCAMHTVHACFNACGPILFKFFVPAVGNYVSLLWVCSLSVISCAISAVIATMISDSGGPLLEFYFRFWFQVILWTFLESIQPKILS